MHPPYLIIAVRRDGDSRCQKLHRTVERIADATLRGVTTTIFLLLAHPNLRVCHPILLPEQGPLHRNVIRRNGRANVIGHLTGDLLPCEFRELAILVAITVGHIPQAVVLLHRPNDAEAFVFGELA